MVPGGFRRLQGASGGLRKHSTVPRSLRRPKRRLSEGLRRLERISRRLCRVLLGFTEQDG